MSLDRYKRIISNVVVSTASFLPLNRASPISQVSLSRVDFVTYPRFRCKVVTIVFYRIDVIRP